MQSNAAIDLKLTNGQSISGHVQGTANTPLSNVSVFVFDANGKLAGEGSTNALGNYFVGGGLTGGTYYAATTNGVDRGVGGGYINVLYSGITCPLACAVTAGTPITVGSSPVANINFNLGKGVGFAGKVVDRNNIPLALITIMVVNASGSIVGNFSTDSLGKYHASGLPAGTYYARTKNSLGLLDILYGGAYCIGNCSVLASAPILISASSQPQTINFLLEPVDIFANGFE